MQALGYMNLRGTGKGYTSTVLILVRQGTCGRYIKLRKSGKRGTHFSDEELYINTEIEQGDINTLERLMSGETIFL